jgi:hypothetical protein
MKEKDTSSWGQRSEADLKNERESVAAQSFASKFGGPDHDHLEERFNNIERELFILNGGQPNKYKYKHDVRHYFAFHQTLEGGRVAEQRAEMATLPDGKGTYALKPTDEVIDWRDTEAGRKADASLRRRVADLALDDAGHLIGLQFGTDPRERRNVVPQNCFQNQGGGTWHRSEKDLKEQLDRYSSCHVGVTVRFKDEKFGQRVSSWKMDAWGVDGKGATVRFNDNIIHLNTVAHYSSRSEGFKHMAQVRETRKALGKTPVELKVHK